jgi:hypothetical protein
MTMCVYLNKICRFSFFFIVFIMTTFSQYYYCCSLNREGEICTHTIAFKFKFSLSHVTFFFWIFYCIIDIEEEEKKFISRSIISSVSDNDRERGSTFFYFIERKSLCTLTYIYINLAPYCIEERSTTMKKRKWEWNRLMNFYMSMYIYYYLK